jgi:hypothetical protein
MTASFAARLAEALEIGAEPLAAEAKKASRRLLQNGTTTVSTQAAVNAFEFYLGTVLAGNDAAGLPLIQVRVETAYSIYKLA